MIPVRFYVDGFNLYHALLKFKNDKVKWLDLELLCHRIIAPRTEASTGFITFPPTLTGFLIL
jgi:hypothetical protein